MMTSPITTSALLYLSVPVSLSDELADFFRSHPELISGFTSLNANGMGPNIIFGSIVEQVQGQSHRKLFMSEAPIGQIEEILSILQKNYRGADMHFWVMPVLQSGSLR